MFETLPNSIETVRDWSWDDIKPYFDDLMARDLSADNIDAWMTDWSSMNALLTEMFSRARLATTQDTTDEEAEAYLKHLYADIFPHLAKAGNKLDKKLVESGLEPENFELPLKKIRTGIEIFREENIELTTRTQALGMEYDKINGAQTIQWEGEELTIKEANKLLEEDDRAKREQVWHLIMDRWAQDRQAINELWVKFFETRKQMATNAGFDNFRDYQWQNMRRFDYTPDDCVTFHNAIEQVVVPAAKRRLEARRQQLGVDSVRPWDLVVDTSGKPPLRPWQTLEEFQQKGRTVFNAVDPKLGGYYDEMLANEMMDLPNRKGKGPGAYCTRFPMSRTPYVFMNATGTRDDIRTFLHEFGHAFHGFECFANLPYIQQQSYPIEFAEVASMAMELLAAPYLTKDKGGFYSEAEAARDRVAHLDKILAFWPYMAVVDAFQHWIYTSRDAAMNTGNLDAKWSELWDRFMPEDWSGLQAEKETGWHRKLHIHRVPFYYIEYGLAELGAVQVWANAIKDQSKAVADYRAGLALGGTASLPVLFGTAGAKFAFDADTLGAAVELLEGTINELEEKV